MLPYSYAGTIISGLPPPIIKMSILLWCRRAAAARQQGDVANSPKFNMDGAGTGGQMDLYRAEWTE